VLTAIQTTSKFSTLRDQLGGGNAFIEPQRLVLKKALGEGAFAKVQQAELWPEGATPRVAPKARQVSAGSPAAAQPRLVAVKTLKQELLEDPEQVKLFAQEVALMRKLKHR